MSARRIVPSSGGSAASLANLCSSRGPRARCATSRASAASPTRAQALRASSHAAISARAAGPSAASRRGITSASGLPLAADAGAAARSYTSTVQPRSRKARAAHAPATPAPTMAMRCGGIGAGARSAVNRASRRSFLRPCPVTFATSKPSSLSVRRTCPATVYVAARAPGAHIRATCVRTSGVHIAGFFAGAKPSRNHASAAPLACGSVSATSPIQSVSVTPSGRAMR